MMQATHVLLPADIITLMVLNEEVLNIASTAEATAVKALGEVVKMRQLLEFDLLAPSAQPEIEVDKLDVPIVMPAPLFAHGEMWAYNLGLLQVMAVINTKYEVTLGMTAGLLDLCSFNGTHRVKALRKGRYLADWAASFTGTTPNDQIEFGLMVNGVAILRGTSDAASSAATNVSGHTFLDLNGLDEVSLYSMNQTAGRNATINHVSVTIVQIRSF
jgi:hypothetical protein